MYLLPATSFMRHDYSEMFRIAPEQEFGRNDTGKFGFFLVDVHERGHVAHFVRTGGATLDQVPGCRPACPAYLRFTHAPIHMRRWASTCVTRQNWPR